MRTFFNVHHNKIHLRLFHNLYNLRICGHLIKQVPYTFYSKHDWAIFYSWTVIRDEKIFSCLFERIFLMTRELEAELNVIREQFCSAW